MTQNPHSTSLELLARRFVKAFNARDTTALHRLYHPDATVKRPTWPAHGGVEASLDSIQLDFGAYPDGRLEVTQIVVQDQVAVVEFQFAGTNTRPLTLFNGHEEPATGRPLRLNGTIVLETDQHDLITAERQYWEVYSLIEFWTAVGIIESDPRP